ncbi:MAG: hypothetical protein OSB30_07035, partial [Candidatus Poseidoniaceae archaeon]|nr:hypothetical protein [Candidatus Poseidoniaceae archaeon]
YEIGGSARIKLNNNYEYMFSRGKKPLPKDPQISLLTRLDETRNLDEIIREIVVFYAKFKTTVL